VLLNTPLHASNNFTVSVQLANKRGFTKENKSTKKQLLNSNTHEPTRSQHNILKYRSRHTPRTFYTCMYQQHCLFRINFLQHNFNLMHPDTSRPIDDIFTLKFNAFNGAGNISILLYSAVMYNKAEPKPLLYRSQDGACVPSAYGLGY
jgi:hypothetical protein